MQSTPLAALLVLTCACGSTPPATEPAVRPPTPVPRLTVTGKAAEATPDRGEPDPGEPDPGEPEHPGESSAPVEKSARAADDFGERLPLGWVAGEPLFPEELLLEWYHVAGRELELVVDKLVATRLAYAEAGRLGLRLSPDAVAERTEAEKRRLLDDLEARGETRSLEEIIREQFGTGTETYFARMRQATIRQMIAERVVRAWSLSNENRTVRVLVVPEEDFEEVETALSDGADFAALAREKSVDDSAADGGRIPYLVRQEVSPLARIAFATEVGEIGGPIEASGHRVLVRVEEHRDPFVGDWETVGPRVEATLAADPLRDAEFVHWKLAMERRYPIDLRPLEELMSR